MWKGCERSVFLPTSFIFAFVQVRLPHVFCLPTCPPTAVLYLSVLTVSTVQFQHRVEGLRTHRFLAGLSSDLGGVWLFRIRCRRASFLPLSKLGCPTFFAYLYLPTYCGPLPVCFNGFEGAVSAPCRGRVANAPFFGLPELGFRWRLAVSRCRRASFLPLSRLGCPTFFAYLYLPTYRGPLNLPVCFNGFEGAVSAPCGRVANAPFFGWPELGFRWCLAVSDPLPKRTI